MKQFDAGPGGAFRIAFGLPFEGAIAAAAARGVELPEEYYARAPGEARRAATTVSGLAGLQQIQAVVDSFDQFLSGEKTVEQWVGWALDQGWGLSPARLETIVRTNIQTAYSSGRWRAIEANKGRRPYLMWSAINDSRVRPAHLAMDGYIAPVDDPIWKVWHPPAGFNCRCAQISLTEAQAIARGYGKQVRPDAKPDQGFAGVASVLDALKGAIEKLKNLCATFLFAGTRKWPPVWCKDDGEVALARIERSLEDRYRLDPPAAIAISEFAARASTNAVEHAILHLGTLSNASRIAAATGLVLVKFSHALDSFGIRHALKGHGERVEVLRGQRPLSPYDFLRAPEIVSEFDAVELAGFAKKAGTPLLSFEKRIGNEVFVYVVAVRAKRRLLATHTMWVRRARP
ncbi:MAG: minor capsid protein [Burkholderiales bacterium]|nr:minor capsid protein [Burkholderiales bacterium]